MACQQPLARSWDATEIPDAIGWQGQVLHRVLGLSHDVGMDISIA